MGGFAAQRPDGRSDRRVIVDLVADVPPETLFSYDDLRTALQDGVDMPITRTRAGQAVRTANRTLLKVHRRYLDNERGQGYRMLGAAEHRNVSVRRQTRAEREVRRGIDVIRHVRLEELDENQRRLTVGQLTIMNGMYMMMQGQQVRQDRMDQLIEGLEQRMHRLEDHQGSEAATGAA